jgi:hypothetical protein
MIFMNSLKIFEEKKVRSLCNEEEEKWYFSIIDVVSILSESIDANSYWRKLKQRLKAENACYGWKNAFNRCS